MKRSRIGFTLLELIIVIIILGILAAIALPRYFSSISEAQKAEARASLDRIREAQVGYYSMFNAYDANFPVTVMTPNGITVMEVIQPAGGTYTYVLGGKAASTTTTVAGAVNYRMCYGDGNFGTTAALAESACP